MKAHHWVEDDALQKVITRALDEARRRKLNNDMRAALIRKKVDEYLAKQPPVPDVVGVAAASEMIRVPKPRIARLRDQGRMPEALYELPSGPLWLRAEVQELAEQYATERAQRRAQQAAAEAAAAA